MIKKTLFALACLTLLTISSHASATNIYIAQNATGAANGADCGDAKPVSFFNTSGNWGSGSAQIGPGTTVHLCGTFTGSANSTMLTIQGSGSNGSPVTILFESGAKLNAPYWSTNGAIFCPGASYITIDGGTNGAVTNNANGTNLSNQADSRGLYFNNCSHIEVRNLAVNNIYQHQGSGSDGVNTFGIYFDGQCDFLSVHNNSIMMVRGGIFVAYETLTSGNFYANSIDHTSWSLDVLDDNSSSRASNINVYNNNIGPHFADWQDVGQAMHADGIFLSAFNTGATFTNSNVYNNYVHGDMCGNGYGNCTAYIFLTGTMSNMRIFNNVVVHEVSGAAPESNLRLSAGGTSGGTFSNIAVYNNTIAGTGQSSVGIKSDDGSGFVYENNIFSNLGIAILSNPNNFNMISVSNFNNFYANAHVACQNAYSGGACYDSLQNWQSVSSKDANSNGGNPNLTVSYLLQTVSAALGLGTNLTNLGITQLNVDKAGVTRPSSGAWTAGAYQGGTPSGPSAPTSLTAIVQ